MKRLLVSPLLAGLLALTGGWTPAARQAPSDPPKGQRVFVAGHSFHLPMTDPFDQIAKSANVPGHKLAGRQMIGGSTVTQHWDLPDEKNKAKKALTAGEVDVLTLSPHLLMPDRAIDKFTALLLEHNPNGRVTVQASWLPRDGNLTGGFKNAQRDTADMATQRKLAAPWYEAMRKQVKEINDKYKKTVVLVVPVGEAVYRLRERVAKGAVPGYAKQSELFTDDLGHAKTPVGVLTAYCHFAAIYGKSPFGLPTPPALKSATDADKLNRILQEVAWEAVTAEPMSGVKP
jgi:hypothetical protein